MNTAFARQKPDIIATAAGVGTVDRFVSALCGESIAATRVSAVSAMETAG